LQQVDHGAASPTGIMSSPSQPGTSIPPLALLVAGFAGISPFRELLGGFAGLFGGIFSLLDGFAGV
jgi:hypothetical protein